MTLHQIPPRIPENKAARPERGWQTLRDRLPIFLADVLPVYAVCIGATIALCMGCEVVAGWLS